MYKAKNFHGNFGWSCTDRPSHQHRRNYDRSYCSTTRPEGDEFSSNFLRIVSEISLKNLRSLPRATAKRRKKPSRPEQSQWPRSLVTGPPPPQRWNSPWMMENWEWQVSASVHTIQPSALPAAAKSWGKLWQTMINNDQIGNSTLRILNNQNYPKD